MSQEKLGQPEAASRAPVIAVFNDDPAVVRLITLMLETEGFRSVGALLDDMRRGNPGVVDFLTKHDPKVVICDVPPPYDENWGFLGYIAGLPEMEGRVLICTTTNREQLLQWNADAGEVVEVVGKPFNPDTLLAAVYGAFEALEKQPPVSL